MFKQLRDLWRYTFRNPDDPIFRKERTGWTYMDLLRSLNKGCLPLMAVAIVLSSLGCGLVGIIIELNIYVFIIGFILGLFLVAAIIDWVTGWIATALTATTISAEIESETFNVLRATSRSPHEIVMAKYGAAMHQIHLPIFTPVVLRILAVLITLFTLLVALVLEVDTSSIGVPALPDLLALALAATQTRGWLFVLFLGVICLILYGLVLLVGPILRTMLFAAIGMFGSSVAKTRANGLLAAIGIRVGFGIFGYAISQFFSFFLSFGVQGVVGVSSVLPAWLEALLDLPPALYVQGGLLVFIAYCALYLTIQVGLVWAFLRFATDRVKKLSFQT